MENRPKYSIVVPVFNSSSTINELVEQIITNVKHLNKTFELILVDDCSSDNSWEVMKTLKEKHEELKLIRLGNNFGQFAATFCGVEHALADIVITIDDDLQYPPSEIPKLISHFENNKQLLVYGVPKNKKHSLKTKLYGMVMQLVVYLTIFRFYMPKGFYYTGFRVFNKTKLWSDKINGIAQHFDIYALWHLNPKYIGFAHVDYSKRKKGKSGQTFRKKSNDAILNAMCTFRSPLQMMYNLFLIFLLLSAAPILLWIIPLEITIPKHSVFAFLFLFAAILCFNLYIIGVYLGRIYTLKRGYQDYFIIEKIN